MRRLRAAIVAAVVMAGWAGSAHAALMSVDSAFGAGSATRDTESGLLVAIRRLRRGARTPCA